MCNHCAGVEVIEQVELPEHCLRAADFSLFTGQKGSDVYSVGGTAQSHCL